MDLCIILELIKFTVKYFIPGHTFKTADYFHAAVEKKIKRKKLIFVLDEYEQVPRLLALLYPIAW